MTTLDHFSAADIAGVELLAIQTYEQDMCYNNETKRYNPDFLPFYHVSITEETRNHYRGRAASIVMRQMASAVTAAQQAATELAPDASSTDHSN